MPTPPLRHNAPAQKRPRQTRYTLNVPRILIVDDDGDTLKRMTAVVGAASVGCHTDRTPEKPPRNTTQESCLSHERAAERMGCKASWSTGMGAAT